MAKNNFFPILVVRYYENPNLASRGRRDFPDTAKCAQCPCLYTSCEQTYVLKCIFFEKIEKNCFYSQKWLKYCESHNSAPKGRRGFTNVPKCVQNP